MLTRPKDCKKKGFWRNNRSPYYNTRDLREVSFLCVFFSVNVDVKLRKGVVPKFRQFSSADPINCTLDHGSIPNWKKFMNKNWAVLQCVSKKRLQACTVQLAVAATMTSAVKTNSFILVH